MRAIICLNRDWQFYADPQAAPESRELVCLPHTWNAEDGTDGGGDYARGVRYYEKRIYLRDLPSAAQYYLEFRGANSSAEVYWNGEKIARHDGGYSTWRVRLPKPLAENTVVVAVDNSPTDCVYPQMADFTFYGGLYRGVTLICVPEQHFDLMYYGGCGMSVTPKVKAENAEIHITSYLSDSFPARIRYTILDASGKVAAEKEGGTSETLLLANVHLWNGREDPYLYTARAELLCADGVIDKVETRFGCRTFSIDPDLGFFLNGKSYPLRGVSRHQDRKGFGNALLPEHHMEDMELICELGANTIRLAHYQHDAFFYDLCDERGMIVWAEIPYISRHLQNAKENAYHQMRELIVQNYHHPSIVVWGLSNEITMAGDRDADLLATHRTLNDLCHELDSTRKTAIAVVSMCPTDSPYLQIPDVVSYNHYFGWYGGDVGDNGPWFDAFHRAHPCLPIGCSEYGCEALDWHTSEPIQGDYTEEYQAYYHEELIKQLFSRPYLWATYVWNMFDFGADAREEGGEHGQNHKGLVTFDRTYKKDAFYAYKAWLSKEPFVHICGKRYVRRAEDVTRITVYSNQPEVSLYVNGKLLATERAPDKFFRFSVPLDGEVRLTAIAGSCHDESVLVRVETFDERYRLHDAGAVLNWFDISPREGRFSLFDKLADVLAVPKGRALFADFFGDLPTAGETMAGFPMTEEMLGMMGGFTVLRLTSMLGTLGKKPTKEELLALDAALGAIEKP